MSDTTTNIEQGNGPLDNTQNPNIPTDNDTLLWNQIISRANLMAEMGFDRRRDIDAECGHPKTDPSAQEYQWMFDRNPYANRVVSIFPSECWRVQPMVYEDENPENITDFEEVWDAIGKKLRGSQSWHKQEEGSPIWEILYRADVLSGIGRFGVILIGINDGKELSEPADAKLVAGKEGLTELNYLQVYPESAVEVTTTETDKTSQRFGKPVLYRITFDDPSTNGGRTNATVHWTRVIHIADNTQSNALYGQPRQKVVWNNLLDLKKLLPGSAEMYWQAAIPHISFETNPQLGGDVKVDIEMIRTMMMNVVNGLQRWIVTKAMQVHNLAPTVSDPSVQIDKQLEAISIVLDCPIRILKGSERGELSSAQDEGRWNKRIHGRHTKYLTSSMVVPLVDRFIMLGVLPVPKDGYFVEWPDVTVASEEARIDTGTKRSAMMVNYVKEGLQFLMAPMDFLTRIVGFTEEEAQTIIDNAAEFMEQMESEIPEVTDDPSATGNDVDPTDDVIDDSGDSE